MFCVDVKCQILLGIIYYVVIVVCLYNRVTYIVVCASDQCHSMHIILIQ